MDTAVFSGARVSLRTAVRDHVPSLTRIRSTPEVYQRWGRQRHAGIDFHLDPAFHGGGLGIDAVRTLARHLIDDLGHHRLVIDPAADNDAAIRCYAKVGFRLVRI